MIRMKYAGIPPRHAVLFTQHSMCAKYSTPLTRDGWRERTVLGLVVTETVVVRANGAFTLHYHQR
jgi:hypothetical protein